MNKDWERNILKAIHNIADLKYQKESWLGKNLNHVSSFGELYNVLFDDFSYDYFLEKNNLFNLGISPELEYNMVLLKDLLESYQEKGSAQEILNDPEWLKVIDQAKKVVELWIKEDPMIVK